MSVSSDKSPGPARGEGSDVASPACSPDTQSSRNLSPDPLPSEVPSQPSPWLTIVGIGEDGAAGLGEAARTAILDASLVFGGARHLSLAAALIRGTAHTWPTPFDPDMKAVVTKRGSTVCVLASGDPFLHGVGATLSRVIDAREMRVFPAASAFSLAAARMAWPLQDVVCLSLHTNSPETLRRDLQPGRRIIALTSGATGPAEIVSHLCLQGFGQSTITVLEALGGPRELATTHKAAGFSMSDIHPLNVVAIEVATDGHDARTLPLSSGLSDDWFEHDGQITKRDIRALTISALQPRPGEYLWDVGAGAGSVAIEWLLAHPSMRATAIEADPVRAARIGRNAVGFGLSNLQVIEGRAPDALQNLPAPDAIFIGGGGTREGVMEAAIDALLPGGRLVANAVTVEMQTKLSTLYARHGGRLIQINLSEAAPIGTLTTWRPALPIVQWSWSKT